MKSRHIYLWIWLIIFINIGIYLIVNINQSVETTDYLVKWGYYKNNLNNYCALFTCQFIHSGSIHLIGNVVSMYYVARKLVYCQSSLNSFIIYLFGIIFVALGLFLFARENIVYIGNSGAICDLFGSWLFYGIKKSDMKKFHKEQIEVISFIIISSIIIPFISLLMHLSGLITGYILSFILYKNAKTIIHIK